MTDEKVLEAICGSPDSPLVINGIEIPCYVLEDEKRVLVHRAMVSALGMKYGTTNRGADRLQVFVNGDRIKPFVSSNLLMLIDSPLKFRAPNGQTAYGYEASALAEICFAVIEADEKGLLQKQQKHIAERCRILVRGFAIVGINALVDEATGYQDRRVKNALAKILEKYIAEEYRAWTKMFPVVFNHPMPSTALRRRTMNGTPQPRCRDLGIHIGPYAPGPENAITDVSGVRVGHTTLIRGEGPLVIGTGPVRTGVTAILPPGDDWFHAPVEAGAFVFNGAGTTAGLSLIDEFGRLETPILLTNTLSVGAAYEGIVQYMVETVFRPRGSVPWFNPVVGETSDAYLNDIGGLHVRPEHAVEAIRKATGGPVAEGNVGAGTGMSAFGFKAGIGTSSRVLAVEGQRAVVGTLVQANFGGRLAIAGVSMAGLSAQPAPPPHTGSSIMMIVATDLPLSNRLLNRVCKRATLGMARAGGSGGHGSGDYVLAFSTTYRQAGAAAEIRRALAADEGKIDPVFEATADATEEAILNALFQAERMVGRDGHVREKLPLDRVKERLERTGLLSGASPPQ